MSASEVNGKKVVEGLLVNGTVLAPVRAVGEALGAKVGWNQHAKTASINGVPVPVELIGGSAYAPVRTIAKVAEALVTWDAINRKVTILKGYN